MIDIKQAIADELRIYFSPTPALPDTSVFASMVFGQALFGIIVPVVSSEDLLKGGIWRDQIPYPATTPAVSVTRSSRLSAIQGAYNQDVVMVSAFVPLEMANAYGTADDLAYRIREHLRGWTVDNSQIYVESVVPQGTAEITDKESKVIQRHVSFSVLYAAGKR